MYLEYWWSKIGRNSFTEHGNECVCSYTVCIVLAVISLTFSIGNSAYFTYRYRNRKKENVYQAANYLIWNGGSKTNKY